jgi:hypothetical protein
MESDELDNYLVMNVSRGKIRCEVGMRLRRATGHSLSGRPLERIVDQGDEA